jgi:hypothetical protein
MNDADGYRELGGGTLDADGYVLHYGPNKQFSINYMCEFRPLGERIGRRRYHFMRQFPSIVSSYVVTKFQLMWFAFQ